ncbi:MAG: lysophospholipid acyltransferase family protein [Candidatus Krumholzibacteria bacterium]
MTIAPTFSAGSNNRHHPPLSFAVAAGLASAVPHWLLYAASRVGGAVHYCMAGDKRRNYLANTRSLPKPRRHRPWHAFQNQALNVLELLKAASEGEVASDLSLHGEHTIRSALDQGRGLILTTFHTGNWELAGLQLALRGYPVTTVAGEQLRKGWSDQVKALKERFGLRMVGPGGGVRELVRNLQANRVVALHLDGDLFIGGLEVLFFNRRVRVPRGPAHLSRITGAPIAFAFSHRTGKRQLELTIENKTPPPASADEELRLTQRLVTRVEERITEAPGQWCIFRRIE